MAEIKAINTTANHPTPLNSVPRFPFPFRHLVGGRPCYSGWHRAWGRPGASRWVESLLATWQTSDCAPSDLQGSMEPPGTAKCQADSVGKSTKQKCRDGRAGTLCFYMGYKSRAEEEDRREEPCGKRRWLCPSNVMERRWFRGSHWGQIETLSKVSLNRGGEGESKVRHGLWALKR